MSTKVDIQLFSNKGKVDINHALDNAAEEFFRITSTYTRFSKDSELSRLNLSPDTACKVSKEFFKLIEFMLELAKFSNGKYDPTVIDLLELHGYKNSFNAKEIKKYQKRVVNMKNYLRKRASYKEIKLDPKNKTVMLRSKQKLDLGAVGKGYAIDCAVKSLSKVSSNFLISAGGDVYARGKNLHEKRPWRAEMRVQFSTQDKLLSIGYYELDPKGQALASSGSWARSVGKFHHLIDIQTGKPQKQNIQSFVVARGSLLADGLATVLFLCGKSYLDKIAKKYKSEGFLIDKYEKFYASDRYKLIKH
jgi:thiamine biosynthesis lipoprotein